MSNVAEFEISDSQSLQNETRVARKLIFLVFLVALKYRASRLHFEPSATANEWKLHYEESGVWVEMEPVPLHVPISREIRRMARLGFMNWLRRWSGAWFKVEKTANEGKMRLVVAGEGIDITISLHSPVSGSHEGEAVMLNLPTTTAISVKADQFLQVYEKLVDLEGADL